MTYRQLYGEVAGLVMSLKSLGLKPGERVVGFMPNMPQTMIAMLATTSLGATWSYQGIGHDYGQADSLR